jgi:hypothetical protein
MPSTDVKARFEKGLLMISLSLSDTLGGRHGSAEANYSRRKRSGRPDLPSLCEHLNDCQAKSVVPESN